MKPISVGLTGIGIAAPGLRDWETARAVLAGAVRYAHAPLETRVPEALPPAERRRAGPVTRLAVAVAQEAAAHAGADATALASVFASADGDGETVHQICTALAADAPEISPTRFHNSVQNAASGYWSIAMQSRASTTAVNGLDTVFASALLEAAVQAAIETRNVLLVAYDLPVPAPLHALHPVADGAGVALVLAPAPAPRALATLGIEVGAGDPTRVAAPALEELRLANPPMRALPLLLAVARREAAEVVLALDGSNALKVTIHAARAAS
jgi:hypothetical protein